MFELYLVFTARNNFEKDKVLDGHTQILNNIIKKN